MKRMKSESKIQGGGNFLENYEKHTQKLLNSTILSREGENCLQKYEKHKEKVLDPNILSRLH